MKKVLLIILIIAVIFGIIYFGGLYPFMRVNGEFVSKRTTDLTLNVARKMKADLGLQNYDAEVDALNSMVMDMLISAELEKEFKPEILQGLIDERLKNSLDSINEAAKELNIRNFKEILLLPQIKSEILRSQFILKDKDIESWISETKKSAKVTLFSGRFRFEGGSIKRN